MSTAELIQAREMVEQSDLKGALNLLKSLCPDNTVSDLLGRLSKLTRQEHARTISESDHAIKENQLRNDILSLISELENRLYRSDTGQVEQNYTAAGEDLTTKDKDMQIIGNHQSPGDPARLSRQVLGDLLQLLSHTQQKINGLAPDSQYITGITSLLVALEEGLDNFAQHLVGSGNSRTALEGATQKATHKTSAVLQEIAKARRNKNMADCREYIRAHEVPYIFPILEELEIVADRIRTGYSLN